MIKIISMFFVTWVGKCALAVLKALVLIFKDMIIGKSFILEECKVKLTVHDLISDVADGKYGG